MNKPKVIEWQMSNNHQWVIDDYIWRIRILSKVLGFEQGTKFWIVWEWLGKLIGQALD